MKKIQLMLAAVAVVSLVSCSSNQTAEAPANETPEVAAPAVEGEKYTLNTEESVVAWRGEAIGSHFHTGTVGLKEGYVEIAEGKVVGGDFTLDVTSIDATDENYSDDKGHTKADFIGHLSTGDFLLIEEFPEAAFKVTSAAGDKVTGDFTVRGITKEETATVTSVEEAEGTVTVTAEMTFDRQKYDVSFGMKDIVIDDNVPLTITLVATK